MPYASNAQDGIRVYFEDNGGDGEAVVLHGGLVDSVDLVRASNIAQALQELPEEFRIIYVDHRGVGRSDKPHEMEAYAMPLRVADAVAVLEELGIERAHFIGNSWGGRLGFGIGEHAPERVLSLVIGGQQPYAIDPNGPLAHAVTETLAESRRKGSLEASARLSSSTPSIEERRNDGQTSRTDRQDLIFVMEMEQYPASRASHSRDPRHRSATPRSPMEIAWRLMAPWQRRMDPSWGWSCDLSLGSASHLRCRLGAALHAHLQRSLRYKPQPDVCWLDLALSWRCAHLAKRLDGRIRASGGRAHPRGCSSRRAHARGSVRGRVRPVPQAGS